MSGQVRARRPYSPPPSGQSQSQPSPPVYQSQRFPHPKEGHLDADAKREAAAKGYQPSLTYRSHPNAYKYYPPGGLSMTSGEFKLLILITVIASFIRLFRLSQPNSVVFDEVHFGKFAGKYIKTQYFVDVHPPLAKLLITLMGFIFGYDGQFDFKDIGKVYEPGVPYIAMRFLPAFLGILTVPLCYMTLRQLECRATTALLASLFLTFENGLVTQSRHILLDSPLVFFTSLTTFLWTGFCNEDKHLPFTETWWAYLFLSGLSLGAVVSCKWVGLFTIATVGVSTLWQLWCLLGDLKVTPRLFLRHFIARAICLILIPAFFYMSMFAIHFAILQSSGDGDGFMSSEFQHTLSGRGMADTYADVALGSIVTIRHVNTQGGYIHSHPHVYPGGSKQQQITLYPHRDSNNNWQILNATHDLPSDLNSTIPKPFLSSPLQYVTPGMRVKLLHTSTGKYLHSHDVRPPVSDVEFQNEVSGYGMEGFGGDANDDWILEIDKDSTSKSMRGDREALKRLRTLRTRFRLRHPLTGCYLFSHKVKLPDWGFEQQEVTCNKNAVRENSLWFVESNWNEILPEAATKVNYHRPSFLTKFLELQQVMWSTNKGLTDRHAYDSRPESWLWLRRGINFWVKDHKHIYLLGNPVVWWLSSTSVVMYVLATGFGILRAKRGYRDLDNTLLSKTFTLHTFFFTAWFLHYFPFFLMARQLFLHHYFPALYFSILLFGVTFDFLSGMVRVRGRIWIAFVLVLLAILTFSKYSALVYGSPWTKEACKNAKLLKTWDFSCSEYYDDLSQYSGGQINTKVPAQAAKETPKPAAPPKNDNKKGAVVVDNKGKADDHDDDHDDHDDHDDDDHDDDPPDLAHTTSTVIAVPIEPGRDIFAPDDVIDASSAVNPKGKIPIQPKIDTESVVVPAGGGGGGIGAEKERVGTERKEQERELPTTSATSESSTAAAEATTATATEEKKVALGAETEDEMDAIRGEDKIVAGPDLEKKAEDANAKTKTESELDEMD